MHKIIILILIYLTAPAMASTLAFATGGGRGHMFVTEGIHRVQIGSLVRVGYLTSGTDLWSFVEFGRTTIGTPTGNLGGFLTAPVSQNDPEINKAAAGKQIVIWIYSGNTVDNSIMYGAFTSTDASWTIPTTFTGSATESSNVTLATSSGFANVTALRGGYSVGPIEINGITNTLGSVYSFIPEPSVSLMTSLAAIGFLVYRGRQS